MAYRSCKRYHARDIIGMYSEEGRLQRKNWILKIAFPAEDINSKDFVETTIKFLDKFNAIEKPEVQFQYEIM